MRIFSVILLLTGLAIVVGAALAEDGLALFTSQPDIAGNTFVTDDCFPNNDTGFLDPSAETADSGGDGDGFEDYPTWGFWNSSLYARNWNGAADRHRYYDYGISIDSSCVIAGIEVRLDWWLDSTSGTNSMDIELSWDGGTSWTPAKNDSGEHSSEQTESHYATWHVWGSASDTWGHAWTASELSNANFRVRLTSNSTSDFRDFFLDWVPVKVYYGP